MISAGWQPAVRCKKIVRHEGEKVLAQGLSGKSAADPVEAQQGDLQSLGLQTTSPSGSRSFQNLKYCVVAHPSNVNAGIRHLRRSFEQYMLQVTFPLELETVRVSGCGNGSTGSDSRLGSV